jgi:hypothetical protein
MTIMNQSQCIARILALEIIEVTWSETDAENRTRLDLFREYLRRHAQWVHATGQRDAWPYGSVAPALGGDAPDPDADLLRNVRRGMFDRRFLANTLAFASVPAHIRDAYALPDPYQPILALYERGGAVSLEQGVNIDAIWMPAPIKLETYLDRESFISPGDITPEK